MLHHLILLQMIPADSTILLNMTSVLYNEKVFIEPEKFKPQRYLEGDVQKVKQHTIPFGIGEFAVFIVLYYIVYYYMRHFKLAQRANCFHKGSGLYNIFIENLLRFQL